MQVDRTDYQAAHGKLPRGFGLWQFALGRNGSWTTFSQTGNFGEALAAAKHEARALGCTIIAVQS